ncbi:hypothetical protein [Streptomyces sp. NBC_00470]|uniref:hypothetical protein n=1 Tax=Streptomyces sp. NBC_00470 TaxID=2975753 RepID=UPI002F90F87B
MDITTEITNYLGARRALTDAIARDFRNGTKAAALARTVSESSAFGRDQVKEYLAAVALHDAARKALQEAGLASMADVSVTGIRAPREARLTLTADPADTPDLQSLPARIRDALRDFHITLGLLQIGEHDGDTTDADIDAFFLDAQPVRLVRLKPRT